MITDMERFYKEDEKKYIVKDNKLFLSWLSSEMDKGYRGKKIDIIQSLIDKLAIWYELKYPEGELFNNDEMAKDSKDLSSAMDIDQFMCRLSYSELNLLKCPYNSSTSTKSNDYICLSLDNLVDGISIFCESATGMVTLNRNSDEEVLKYTDEEVISVEKLLPILEENMADEYNIDSVRQCVYNHNVDVSLRDKILQLSALKLLYSKDTTPNYGYKRACAFIDDFNEYFDLSLSKMEMDEIMSEYYNKNQYIHEETQGNMKHLFKNVLKK